MDREAGRQLSRMTEAVDRFQSEMGGVMSTEYVPLNDGDLDRSWSDSEPDDASTTVYRAAQAAAVAAPVVFLNEINYDTVGADAGEGIEIAGTAGVDLTGWTVVLYNGSNGASYDTIPLSDIIGDQQNGFGTLSF